MLMPNPAIAKTPERTAIENAIKRATNAGESISTAQIAQATQLTMRVVRKHLANLTIAHKIDNVRGKGCSPALYTWSRGPVLETPTNGPGYTPMKLPAGRPGTVEPNETQRRWSSGIPSVVPSTPTVGGPRISSMYTGGLYDGKELQPNPGITPDRFEAYNLPSLVNGVRVQPKRITAMCVGKGQEVFAPGRLQQ